MQSLMYRGVWALSGGQALQDHHGSRTGTTVLADTMLAQLTISSDHNIHGEARCNLYDAAAIGSRNGIGLHGVLYSIIP